MLFRTKIKLIKWTIVGVFVVWGIAAFGQPDMDECNRVLNRSYIEFKLTPDAVVEMFYKGEELLAGKKLPSLNQLSPLNPKSVDLAITILNLKLNGISVSESVNTVSTVILFDLLNGIHNSIQHSNMELHERASKKNSQYPKNPGSWVRWSVTLNGNFLVFEIMNVQIKPFPQELEREFVSKSQFTLLPPTSRKGHTGSGYGVQSMFDTLEALPKGSSIGWQADGKEVTYTLKVNLARE